MTEFLSMLGTWLVKAGIVAIIVNEVRGAVLAVPVLYGVYASGGTWMAIYLAACSLGGIALSVIVPVYMARKFKLLPAKATGRA